MTRYEEPSCTTWEKVLIFITALAVSIVLFFLVCEAVERQQVSDAINLDSHLTLEQRKDIMGVK